MIYHQGHDVVRAWFREFELVAIAWGLLQLQILFLFERQLVSGIGRTFPLKGREAVLDELWSYHRARFAVRTLQDRRRHPIPTFMGQSGIGK